MRVLLLSWEYPPVLVGGLGRHVEGLARALAAAGHDVRVVTRGGTAERRVERIDGVQVVRSATDPLAVDFTVESLVAWSQVTEHAFVRALVPTLRRWRPDVVHAHDWLVAQTATTAAALTGAPVVTTMHATEVGRHQGWLPDPLNRAIDSLERWLVHSSARVVTCSESMRAEVVRQFAVPDGRVAVIANGVDADRWALRRPRRRADAAPQLVFAGRLVHEKGVDVLLAALRRLRASHPGTQLVVAGAGGRLDDLRATARRLGVARAVRWLGFVPEAELPSVLATADVAVMPSRYEPFGIVALEAALVGTPLVVTDTGGLRDLAAAGVATASAAADDAPALAGAIAGVLADPAGARRAARRARAVVRRDYTWAAIAARTADEYELARGGPGQPSQRRTGSR